MNELRSGALWLLLGCALVGCTDQKVAPASVTSTREPSKEPELTEPELTEPPTSAPAKPAYVVREGAALSSPDGELIERLAQGTMIRVNDAWQGRHETVYGADEGEIRGWMRQEHVRLGQRPIDILPSCAVARIGSTRFTHPDFINRVLFHPQDGSLFSATRNSLDQVSQWEMPTGRHIRGWEVGGFFALSSDGQRLAVASETNEIVIFVSSTGEEILRLQGHDRVANALAFSPDGTRLASGSQDKTLRIWDLESGAQLHSIPGSLYGVFQLAFSADSRLLVSAESDTAVNLWDVASAKLVRRIEASKYELSAIAFSPDGRLLASCGDDRVVRLWQMPAGTPDKELAGHDHGIEAVAFSPDGTQLATAGYGGLIILWDLATGRPRRTFRHPRSLHSLAFSGDGRFLAAAAEHEHSSLIWDLVTGEPLPERGHRSPVRFLATLDDGDRFASAGRDVFLWDFASGQRLHHLEIGSGDFSALSPDGNTAASSSGTLVDVTSGEEIWYLEGRPKALLFSPNGSYLAAGSGWGGPLEVWDLATRTIKQSFAYERLIASVAFSPDCTYLALGTDGSRYSVWNLTTGTLELDWEGDGTHHVFVAFSADGRMLAAGCRDGSIAIRSLFGDRQVLRWQSDVGVYSVEFLPSDDILVTGCADGRLRIWDLKGALIKTVKGHKGRVTQLATSADGAFLASGSEDTTILLWQVEKLLDQPLPER